MGYIRIRSRKMFRKTKTGKPYREFSISAFWTTSFRIAGAVKKNEKHICTYYGSIMKERDGLDNFELVWNKQPSLKPYIGWKTIRQFWLMDKSTTTENRIAMYEIDREKLRQKIKDKIIFFNETFDTNLIISDRQSKEFREFLYRNGGANLIR